MKLIKKRNIFCKRLRKISAEKLEKTGGMNKISDIFAS